MSSNVRKIKSADKDTLTSLINDYVKEYVPTEKVYPAKYDPHIGKIYFDEIAKKDSNFLVLIAEDGGREIGFSIAEVHKFGRIEKAYFEGDRRGEVWDIYVKPEFRGNGVGRQLLEEIEKELLKQGCQNITLNSVAMDNESARRMYEKMGYRPFNMRYYKRVGQK